MPTSITTQMVNENKGHNHLYLINYIRPYLTKVEETYCYLTHSQFDFPFKHHKHIRILRALAEICRIVHPHVTALSNRWKPKQMNTAHFPKSISRSFELWKENSLRLSVSRGLILLVLSNFIAFTLNCTHFYPGLLFISRFSVPFTTFGFHSPLGQNRKTFSRFGNCILASR